MAGGGARREEEELMKEEDRSCRTGSKLTVAGGGAGREENKHCGWRGSNKEGKRKELTRRLCRVGSNLTRLARQEEGKRIN